METDGGMTAVAARMGLSRPAAYARVARLRQVLNDDLDQPRTRLSLHLAMLALEQDRDVRSTPAVERGIHSDDTAVSQDEPG